MFRRGVVFLVGRVGLRGNHYLFCFLGRSGRDDSRPFFLVKELFTDGYDSGNGGLGEFLFVFEKGLVRMTFVSQEAFDGVRDDFLSSGSDGLLDERGTRRDLEFLLRNGGREMPQVFLAGGARARGDSRFYLLLGGD